MDPIKPHVSDCCDADIISRRSVDKGALFFDDSFESQQDEVSWEDFCSQCKLPIMYAVASRFRDESCAVVELHDGSLWFFWQQTSNFQHAISAGKYVGQVKRVYASITSERNQYGDMIPYEHHKAFSNRWKDKVRNPEYAL